MKKEEDKRYPNSYKCTLGVYHKAMKRAKKEKTPLATLVEVWVTCYANKIPYLIEEPKEVLIT